MPIIKHISGIHSAPKKFIDYITNKDKTKNENGAKYITGINVPEDTSTALKCMQLLYERCTRKSFFEKPKHNITEDESQKENIRLHHYVQSFSPDEKLSPEEAHQIGLEWAKKVFGDKYQVLVTTHIDKV